MVHDALYYEKYDNKVRCFLCPHHCVIADMQFGLCSVRKNEHGNLKTINYGEITSICRDPIEKKPLYHFKPGKNVLSVGSFGCNFSCGFCQNYSISQNKPESQYVSHDRLVELCLNQDNNIGIAFTYNEPAIWYEYVYDSAKKLKEKDPEQNVILVTDGFIESEPLNKLLRYVDAVNIDLKAFNDEYYKKICRGSLKPVLKTIETSIKKCHVEITTLMVSGLNDSEEEIENIASYLGNLDKNIVLHLSRYFPTYKMDLPPTKIETMLKAKEAAKKHLNYVYLGNVQGIDNSTYCPFCGELLIERKGFYSKVNIEESTCNNCGEDVKIIL